MKIVVLTRMTSTLKKWGQIDSRIKYFMAFGDVSGYDYVGAATDLIPVSEEVSDMDYVKKLTVNSLLKDLGRSITVYNSTLTGYPHTAIYRQVQLVNSVGGTPGNNYNSFWIKVWSADGIGIARVARTG